MCCTKQTEQRIRLGIAYEVTIDFCDDVGEGKIDVVVEGCSMRQDPLCRSLRTFLWRWEQRIVSFVITHMEKSCVGGTTNQTR
jgi:hypothetical protein